MTKFAQATLLIFTGSGVGAALFGAYALVRSHMLGAKKRIITYATVLLTGVAITQGTLLVRLIQSLDTPSPTSAVTWFYIIGLLIQTLGLIGSAKVAIDNLTDLEAKKLREKLNGGGENGKV